MPDPSAILGALQFVCVAAKAVCEAVDEAIEFEQEEQHVLKDLRKGVDSLKSDTLAYKVLLNSMENDTGHPPYTRFIQRYVMGLRAHRLTELIIQPITDRMEMEQ